MFSKWNIKSTCVYTTAPCIMTLTFVSTCIQTLMSKQFLQLSKIRFYTFIKENLEFQHVPEFLKWDIYVLVFINLINTTLVSNHWGWYMYQIFTCKYLVLEVGFLLCQILDGDSLVVYQFYLLSALNNLKKKM